MNEPKIIRLNQFTLDIEFLLISVVQGVALAALAGSAAALLGNLQIEYWLYIASAFLIILVFWSQAIIHALSFIDWPLDLNHNFLYFLASFVEVAAFSQLSSPEKWFAFTFVFFVITGILYVVDLRLIRERNQKFIGRPEGKILYKDIIEGQTLELKALLPIGIMFNGIAFLLTVAYPEFFIAKHFHLILITLQVAFSVLALVRSLRSFKRRARLISESS